MLEKVLILIVAILDQNSFLSLEDVANNPLEKLINPGYVDMSTGFGASNWDYFNESLKSVGVLNILPRKKQDVQDPEIDSKTAAVLDVGTNTLLFSKDSDRKMPIASLTKFVTAIIAIDKLDLSQKVVISKEAIRKGGKRDGLFAGEEISTENLLKIMLVNSNNVAAEAIAEQVGGNTNDFVKLMNDKAKLLGLENTKFFNASGLDGEEENYSTAYEVAQIFDYGLKYKKIWDTLKIQSGEVASLDKKTKHILKSTNKLLGRIQNIEGGKTGFTDDAGECMVLVASDPQGNHKVISVVLNSKDRFKDTQNILKWVFDNFSW